MNGSTTAQLQWSRLPHVCPPGCKFPHPKAQAWKKLAMQPTPIVICCIPTACSSCWLESALLLRDQQLPFRPQNNDQQPQAHPMPKLRSPNLRIFPGLRPSSGRFIYTVERESSSTVAASTTYQSLDPEFSRVVRPSPKTNTNKPQSNYLSLALFSLNPSILLTIN